MPVTLARLVPQSLTLLQVAAIGLALAIAVVYLLFLGLRVLLRFRHRERRSFKLGIEVNRVDTAETVVAQVLDQVAEQLPARAYHGYWLNLGRQAFELKASLNRSGGPGVAPSYSGLVLDDAPAVPLTLSPDDVPDQPSIRKVEGRDLLTWPLAGLMVVHVWLADRQELPPGILNQLEDAAAGNAGVLQALDRLIREQHKEQEQQRQADTTSKAFQLAVNPTSTRQMLVVSGGRLLQASSYFAIIEGAHRPRIEASSQQAQAWGERVLDGEWPQLTQLSTEPGVVQLPAGWPQPDRGQGTALVQVPILTGERILGCLYYLVSDPPDPLDDYLAQALAAIAERIAQQVQAQLRDQAGSGYLGTLRTLVQSMDSLSPHARGHSDRLARWARLTALELGVDPAASEQVAMAAYFHDLGMIALEPETLTKKGRFTSEEYQELELHPTLGAQLVQPLDEDGLVAAAVASHHERWDGRGYPRELAGEDIPLAGRVLACVDYFDAKTTSRSYRSALPYPQAVQSMHQAAGSRLDPRVVEAFLAVMTAEQDQAAAGLPPLPCWQLKQLDEHVCSGCPNRLADPVKCWENPDKLCTRHGDECETCIVYTAARNRGVR